LHLADNREKAKLFEFSFLSVTLKPTINTTGSTGKVMEQGMNPFKKLPPVIVFLSLLSLQSPSQDSTSGRVPHLPLPRLEFAGGSSFDFGDVYRGQKATQVFTIKNSGNDTLLIKNVSASCGCTAAMASTSVVPPRSTSKLNVTFNSEEYGGPAHKTVTVISNDPVNPAQQVSITANVLLVLEPDPPYLFIQNDVVDSVSSSLIKLTNATRKIVKILSAEGSLHGLQGDVTKKTLNPKETTDLRVSYKPHRAGPAYGEIVLRTDFHPQPTVIVRLTANARD
jgi:hypothetical protein